MGPIANPIAFNLIKKLWEKLKTLTKRTKANNH